MRKMFAVCNECGAKPAYGVYSTRADAEEAILAECEDYVDWMDAFEDLDKQYERIVSAVDRGVLEKETNSVGFIRI